MQVCSTRVRTATGDDSAGATGLRGWHEALERREAALMCAERELAERTAAWETRRRLWETEYEARLAALELREATLGQPNHLPL